VNQLLKNLQYLKLKHPEWMIGVDDNPTIMQLEALCARSSVSLQNLVSYNLEAEELPWENIRFIFLDVDGVMTEGGMFYTEKGDEFKRFDTKDGMAIKKAMDAGIQIGIISSGFKTEVISHRASMFGIEYVHVGREKKEMIAEKWLHQLNLDWNQCGYIGDDINDMEMMKRVGISGAPANAVSSIKSTANFVLQQNGGFGCVREFISYLPALKNQL